MHTGRVPQDSQIYSFSNVFQNAQVLLHACVITSRLSHLHRLLLCLRVIHLAVKTAEFMKTVESDHLGC